MGILSETSLLSFEVADCCNLMKEHNKCPINHRKYKYSEFCLDEDIIVDTLRTAIQLGFTGLVAFHYYNEPLLKRELIMNVIEHVPEGRFLLWTNALLLDRNVKNNEFLRKFSQVNITCYNFSDLPFFQALKEYYGNIEIFDWELDDRLQIYEKTIINNLSCKRPLFELPIDYHGNIHLCCMDWNNDYEIGNIFIEGFESIVMGEKYQKLISSCKSRLNITYCPNICKTCDKMWVSYPKYYKDV